MSPPQGVITCVKETEKEHLLSRITTQVNYEAPLRGTGWLQMRLENATAKDIQSLYIYVNKYPTNHNRMLILSR